MEFDRDALQQVRVGQPPPPPQAYLLTLCASIQLRILLTTPALANSSKLPTYTLIATQTPQPDPNKPTGHAPDFTAIILTLLRLEKESTDVLITINVPHIKGEYDEDDVDLELGKQGRLIGDAVEHAAEIWKTFKVKDWGLFNEV